MISEFILFVELDRTLIPNGPQPESYGAREMFAKLIAQEQVSLVYVTGRHRSLAAQAIENYNLPFPDCVIADAGVSIYEIRNKEWHLLTAWSNFVAKDKDWSERTSDVVSSLCSDLHVLRKQEASKQNTYKLSYYVPLYVDYERLVVDITRRLAAQNLCARLVWSVDDPSGVGLVDIIPEHATKRNAIKFIMQQRQFEYSNTFFAGTGSSDFDILVSPITSILVANTCGSIKRSVRTVLMTENNIDSVYFAEGGYRNMNGCYSSGVIEGIHKFIPEIDSWLEDPLIISNQ